MLVSSLPTCPETTSLEKNSNQKTKKNQNQVASENYKSCPLTVVIIEIPMQKCKKKVKMILLLTGSHFPSLKRLPGLSPEDK